VRGPNTNAPAEAVRLPVAEREGEFAIEDVPGLVLAAMQVTGRPRTRRCVHFGDGKVPAGLRCGRLVGEETSGKPRGLTRVRFEYVAPWRDLQGHG
jgi:hypothetical protein